MENIMNLDMKMEVEKTGVNFDFKGGLANDIAEKLSDERIEKIKELLNAITHEIAEGLTDYEKSKQVDNKIEDLRSMLYGMLSEDEKKEIDEFHSIMEKLETKEERLAYAFQKLAKTIDKK